MTVAITNQGRRWASRIVWSWRWRRCRPSTPRHIRIVTGTSRGRRAGYAQLTLLTPRRDDCAAPQGILPAFDRVTTTYVHGYDNRENQRLRRSDLCPEWTCFAHDTRYPAGSRVLEAGCGVGAQTVTLARTARGALHVDRHVGRVAAQPRGGGAGAGRHQCRGCGAPICSTCRSAGVVRSPLRLLRAGAPGAPVDAWQRCRVLRPGGTLTVIEGDHGSASSIPTAPRPTGPSSVWSAAGARWRRRAHRAQLYPLLPHAGSRGPASRRASSTSTRAGRPWSRASPARRSRPWSRACATPRSPPG